MSRRDPLRVDRVGLHEQVAEFRERVAADAGNGRAAVRILVHKIINNVATERALEIEDIMRNAELLGTHDARRSPGIERAAWAIGKIVAVTRTTSSSRRRRRSPARRASPRRRTSPRRPTWRPALAPSLRQPRARTTPRALFTRAGNTSATREMQSSVVKLPRLKRIADEARTGSTPNALNTCDGEMLPD